MIPGPCDDVERTSRFLVCSPGENSRKETGREGREGRGGREQKEEEEEKRRKEGKRERGEEKEGGKREGKRETVVADIRLGLSDSPKKDRMPVNLEPQANNK